jgi:hypothetical protein
LGCICGSDGLFTGVAVVLIVGSLLRKAREAGSPSPTAYLRAAPHTDEEKRDAADLALKGLVLCVLGLPFPPVLLFGLVPLFHGTRNVLCASMGLGLADDPNLQGR